MNISICAPPRAVNQQQWPREDLRPDAFTGRDERSFPRWQLADGNALPGLKMVPRALDLALHPLSADHWFTTANVDLKIDGRSAQPVSWLATGGDTQFAADLAVDL